MTQYGINEYMCVLVIPDREAAVAVVKVKTLVEVRTS